MTLWHFYLQSTKKSVLPRIHLKGDLKNLFPNLWEQLLRLKIRQKHPYRSPKSAWPSRDPARPAGINLCLSVCLWIDFFKDSNSLKVHTSHYHYYLILCVWWRHFYHPSYTVFAPYPGRLCVRPLGVSCRPCQSLEPAIVAVSSQKKKISPVNFMSFTILASLTARYANN